MSAIHNDVDITRLPLNAEQFIFGKWTISYEKSHILASVCHSLESCESNPEKSCQFCFFNRELKFPHLPDMVFPDNKLILKWGNDDRRIEFSAMEALRCVDLRREPVQVSCADEWQESRPGVEEKIVKSFDWTFTTDYKGSLQGLESVPTNDVIDIELLKKREQILFYHDLSLFEDELHDHGISVCSVKIRVMPSSWFILLRYFLRVDNVMTKIYDTRMFYQKDSTQILVEYTAREANIPDLKIPSALFTEPNELAQYLPIVSQTRHKIILPDIAAS